MVDYVIVVLYLAIILLLGLKQAGKLKDIKDFSLSSSKYGVFVLIATLSASFIGGGFSTGNATKVAEKGIGNILALCGFSLSIYLVGKFIVPRMSKYEGKISIGEIIGDAYGKKAQVLTGIFSMLVCAGILGAQVGAIGYMFNVFLGIKFIAGVILGCAIVIAYSTFGGMRAVVATDVVQFVVLVIGMPILFVLSYNACGGVNSIIANVPNEYFNIFNGYTILGYISLFLTLALGEALVPPYVQRLLMGQNLDITKKATKLSAIISIPFFIITGLIGLCGVVYFNGMDIDINSIMQQMINNIAPIGLKGLIIAGMLSIVMSSADSFLNSASVALVNDVIIPLKNGRLLKHEELTLVQVVNLLTGVIAVVVSLAIPNILDALMFAYSFWSPVILIPLIFLLLGKKTSKKVFYTSMIFGGIITIIFTYVLDNPLGVDGTIYGVIANLITFVGMDRVYSMKNKKAMPVFKNN